MGEDDARNGVGDGDESFDRPAGRCLEEDEKTEADDERRKDDRYVEQGIDEGAAWKPPAGQEVPDRHGDPNREHGRQGAGQETEVDRVSNFRGTKGLPEVVDRTMA